MSVYEPAETAGRSSGQADMDLPRIFAAVRAKWRWVVIPTIIAFLGSALLVTLLTPRYTAETRLLLESGDSFYTRISADQRDSVGLIDAEAVASQIQIITSRDLARDAVKELKLVGNPEFDPLVGGIGPLQRFLMLVGVAKPPADTQPEDRVLNAFFDRLTVYAAGKSRVVVIEFESRDPDLAAQAANTVARLYLDRQEAAKKETARAASVWLSNTIEPLRLRVAEAEGKVEEFRARAGLFSSGTTTITSQQMADLSTQLATARAAQADSQAKAKLIRELIRLGRGIEIPDVANNELIRRLSEQRVTLRSQLALELRTLLPDHPRIKELNAQLADLDRETRAAAERTVRTLEAEADIAGSRVESLTAALEAQKRQVAVASESEVQLRALEREARTQREQLESYLAKFREASARDAENATPADGRIVSRAVSPLQASFPKKVPIVVLATVGMFVMSLGGLLAGQLLTAPQAPVAYAAPIPAVATPSTLVATHTEPTRPDPADAEKVDPAPRLTTERPLPFAIEKHGTTARIDGEAALPLFDRLAAAPVAGRGRRVLLVASGTVGADELDELAVEASGGRRAVLVSLVGSMLEGGDPAWGFTDLLAGDASFVEVIVRERGSRLHRISLGTGTLNDVSADIESVEVALTALEQTYDVVLIGAAPEDVDALASVFAERIDNVVIGQGVPSPTRARLEQLVPTGTVLAMKDERVLEPA